MTHSNGCRSLLTLTERPWVVTPRLTWTPIEPILRGSADEPDAGLGPDAGQPSIARVTPCSARAPIITCSRPPDEGVDVVAVGGEADDRVGDQLAGAVVGDLAAAVGVADCDPLRFVPLGPHRQFGLGAAPARVDGGVLQLQQDVADLLALAALLQLAWTSRASS